MKAKSALQRICIFCSLPEALEVRKAHHLPEFLREMILRVHISGEDPETLGSWEVQSVNYQYLASVKHKSTMKAGMPKSVQTLLFWKPS